jgi:hypothetical protein
VMAMLHRRRDRQQTSGTYDHSCIRDGIRGAQDAHDLRRDEGIDEKPVPTFPGYALIVAARTPPDHGGSMISKQQ